MKEGNFRNRKKADRVLGRQANKGEEIEDQKLSYACGPQCYRNDAK